MNPQKHFINKKKVSLKQRFGVNQQGTPESNVTRVFIHYQYFLVFMNSQYNRIKHFYSQYVTREPGSFIYLHELYENYKIVCAQQATPLSPKNSFVSKTVFNKALQGLLETSLDQNSTHPVKWKFTKFGICYQNLGINLVENQLTSVTK